MVEVWLPWWPTLSSVTGARRWLASMARFAGGFGVAFEQDAGAGVVEAEDEGVVVDRGAGVGVGGFGGAKTVRVEIGPGEGLSPAWRWRMIMCWERASASRA